MKIITAQELDPGCFLYMTEAEEFENGAGIHWYIGSTEDLVRVSDDIALSLFSLRQTKNNDPLRTDFDSDDWKTECVERYERWIDYACMGGS
jgi:hypothetical protein